jgi:hypothetical protein
MLIVGEYYREKEIFHKYQITQNQSLCKDFRKHQAHAFIFKSKQVLRANSTSQVGFGN